MSDDAKVHIAVVHTSFLDDGYDPANDRKYTVVQERDVPRRGDGNAFPYVPMTLQAGGDGDPVAVAQLTVDAVVARLEAGIEPTSLFPYVALAEVQTELVQELAGVDGASVGKLHNPSLPRSSGKETQGLDFGNDIYFGPISPRVSRFLEDLAACGLGPRWEYLPRDPSPWVAGEDASPSPTPSIEGLREIFLRPFPDSSSYNDLLGLKGSDEGEE